jgi:hypothetical protein
VATIGRSTRGWPQVMPFKVIMIYPR